jgi:hypothetical protein
MTTDKVSITCWVDPWVKEGLRREAYENRRTISSLVSEWLTDSCAHYPENPKQPKRQPPKLQDLDKPINFGHGR